MKSNGTRLLAALVLLSVLLFPGCVGEPGNGGGTTTTTSPPGLSAEEIRDKMLGVEALSSYGFDMSMKIAAAVPVEIEAKAEVDRDNQKMHSTIKAGLLGMTQTTEEYVIGSTQYIKLPKTGWAKKEMQLDLWDGKDVLESQKDLMREIKVTLLGSEKVDGTDCYILGMEPDKEQLASILEVQAGSIQGFTKEELIERVKDIQWKEYVAKDTFLPKRTATVMQMESKGKTMNIDTQIIFRDYNKEFAIELPEEAKNAKEMEEESAAS